MKNKILNITLTFFFFSSKSYSITLEESINLAIENNDELKSYKQQIISSQYQLKADLNLYLPTVYLNVYQKFYNETPMTKIPNFPISFKQSNKDFLTFSVGLNQSLYTGGLTENKIDISKHSIKSNTFYYKEIENNLKADVIKSYIDVFVAKSLVSIYQKEYEAIKSIYKQQEEFFKEGLITKVDLLQSKVRLSEVERSLTEAKGNYKVALAKLSKLIGKNLKEDEDFEKLNIDIKEPENFESLLKIAYENREILKYMEENINIGEKKVDIEKSSFLPKVFIQGEYMYTNQSPYLNPKGNFALTVGTSIEFQGMIPYYKILQAKSDVQKLKFQFNDLKENIKLQLKNALENYKTTKESYKVSEDSLSYAKEYFQLVKEQYENQLATNTDLLNAESAYTRALESREINYYNLYKSYIDILLITGQINKKE